MVCLGSKLKSAALSINVCRWHIPEEHSAAPQGRQPDAKQTLHSVSISHAIEHIDPDLLSPSDRLVTYLEYAGNL